MKTKNSGLALAASLIFLSAFSQPADSVKQQKAQVKISVNYNSNLNYYGRTDSLKSSGFFPMAELWFTPHFYVNAAPVFVNNALQRFEYAGTVTTLGYQSITKSWLTSVYLSKPFYKAGSELVQSALKAQSGASVSFLNSVLNLTAGSDVKFSNKVDLGATGGVDHLIRLPLADNSVLVFDPSLYVYAGTQNFVRTYTQKNSGGNFLFPTATEQQVTEQTTRFSILSYEASVPIIYAKGKWMLIANPAYVLPQNLVVVQGRPDLSERGSNSLYTTLTAKYTF